MDQYRPLLGALLAVVLIGWQFWPSIRPLLSKLPSLFSWGVLSPTRTDAPANDDESDFKALRQVRARFVRLGCKEGIDACQTCLEHFDHTGAA